MKIFYIFFLFTLFLTGSENKISSIYIADHSIPFEHSENVENRIVCNHPFLDGKSLSLRLKVFLNQLHTQKIENEIKDLLKSEFLSKNQSLIIESEESGILKIIVHDEDQSPKIDMEIPDNNDQIDSVEKKPDEIEAEDQSPKIDTEIPDNNDQIKNIIEKTPAQPQNLKKILISKKKISLSEIELKDRFIEYLNYPYNFDFEKFSRIMTFHFYGKPLSKNTCQDIKKFIRCFFSLDEYKNLKIDKTYLSKGILILLFDGKEVIIPPKKTISQQEKTYTDPLLKKPFIKKAIEKNILLKGLVVYQKKEDFGSIDLNTVKNVHFCNVEFPTTSEKIYKQFQFDLYNQPISEKTFLKIRDNLLYYFCLEGHPRAYLEIPDQDLSSGVLQVILHDPLSANYTKSLAETSEKETLQKAYQKKDRKKDSINLPILKGVFLTDTFEDFNKYDLTGITTLYKLKKERSKNSKKLTKEISKNFLGKPITYEQVQKLKKIVQKYFDKANTVYIPHQDIGKGVLQVIATEKNPPFKIKKLIPELSYQQKDCISIRGLILLSDPNDLNKIKGKYGISKKGLFIPKKPVSGKINKFIRHYPAEEKQKIQASLYSSLYSNIIGKKLSDCSLQQIKKIISDFYAEKGYPFIRIQIPEQEISNGIIQVLILPGNLENYTFKGNQYFPTSQLEKHVTIQEDQSISKDSLEKDLYWLNSNPFRNVIAVFSPGNKEGGTNIDFLVNDRKPFRIFSGIDNYGNDIIGNNRYYLGLNHGNIFWTDTQLDYQYMQSENIDKFSAHTANLTVPLPWRNIFSLFGGYSKTEHAYYTVPSIHPEFKTSGWSMQTSGRYKIPLPFYKKLLHEFIFGMDFKRYNNNLEFGQFPVEGQFVNILQAMAAYNLGYTTKRTKTTFEVEAYGQPGKMISDQSEAAYQSLREFAKNHYVYMRGSFSFYWQYFKNLSFKLFLRGQAASANLLQSEQFGIGGYSTVRGYKEREVNGDNAFILNLEHSFSKFSIMNGITKKDKYQDLFEFLVFLDYGWSSKHKTSKFQKKSEYLYSIGPAVRYNIIPYISAKLDLGFQLKNLSLPQNVSWPDHRLHFTVTIGY